MDKKSEAKINRKNQTNSKSSGKIRKTKSTKHTEGLKVRKRVQIENESKTNKKITKNTLRNFEPSMKIIHRIIKCLLKNEAETKTNLSHNANLNYFRLVKHLEWLEKKGIVKLIIKNSKIKVMLTDKGKIFATTITKNEK